MPLCPPPGGTGRPLEGGPGRPRESRQGRRSWGAVNLVSLASLARIVILFIFTEPCKARGWGRSVPATRCQRRSARRPRGQSAGKGQAARPASPAAHGRGCSGSQSPPRPPPPARGPRGQPVRARPGLRARRGSAEGAGGVAGRAPGAGRAAPAARARRLLAAGGPAHVFRLSRSLRPCARPSPSAPPPPAWSCVAFFCLYGKQFSRRGGGEREAGRGGEKRRAGGRTRGAPGGGRRSHAAPRPPRPAARACGRPRRSAAPRSQRRARAPSAGLRAMPAARPPKFVGSRRAAAPPRPRAPLRPGEQRPRGVGGLGARARAPLGGPSRRRPLPWGCAVPGGEGRGVGGPGPAGTREPRSRGEVAQCEEAPGPDVGNSPRAPTSPKKGRDLGYRRNPRPGPGLGVLIEGRPQKRDGLLTKIPPPHPADCASLAPAESPRPESWSPRPFPEAPWAPEELGAAGFPDVSRARGGR